MEPSSEAKKNPMLMRLVISCVLKFLNVKDIKNCRLVCLEWGSTGKLFLGKRGRICFQTNEYMGPEGRPVEFYSRFMNSVTLFSAFKISGFLTKESQSNSWSIEELTKFFHKHQKYIKELTLDFGYSGEKLDKKIDLSSWISKSPMIQKNAKHMTKLSIDGYGSVIEISGLHLIAHIKDLTLSKCRINVEPGILFCSIKLKLKDVAFFQNGIKLDLFRINDIVDLCTTKEISLDCRENPTPTKYFVDLEGNIALDYLGLQGVKIVNGKTSQWVVERLETDSIPYSLNTQMEIEELSLSRVGYIDLSTLPNSIQKLNLRGVGWGTTAVRSRQLIVLENLQYLHIADAWWPDEKDSSFLSHFRNCRQLKHLKLSRCTAENVNSFWMPKSVKTLTLQHNSFLNWVDASYWNLEKLVIFNCGPRVKNVFNAKIRVEHFVVYFPQTDEYLVEFLELRNSFSFGKRLYIGEFKWGDKKLQDSVLNGLVDVKSPFYVFEIDQMGRALSEKDFQDLIPKHIDLGPYIAS